jgi:hypothetical protein
MIDRRYDESSTTTTTTAALCVAGQLWHNDPLSEEQNNTQEGVTMSRQRIISSLALGLIILVGFGCAKPSPFATPDGAVLHVSQKLQEDRPEVLWEALPPSYQKDVTDLTHEFATKMDAELYAKVVTILQKTVNILKTKKEIILGSSLISAAPVDMEKLTQKWDAVVAFLETLVNCELSDLEQLKTIDYHKFLSGTGHQLAVQANQLSDLIPHEYEKGYKEILAGVQVEVISQEAESAVIKVTVPDEPPEELEMVLVEERWLPKEMADDWQKEIAKAREELAGWDEQKIAEGKMQAMMFLGMAEAFLDQLAQVSTSEELDQTIGGLMGGMFGGMAGGMPGEG